MPKRTRASGSLLVRRSPLSAASGILQAGALRMRCALGRSGIGIFKREGDGRTPIATMGLLSAYLPPGRIRGFRPALPTLRPRTDSGWCDAPAHPAYNRPVRLPIAASAETLLRDDGLYAAVIVLDWNYRRRARGLGSAIFLHIARPGYAPTEGCVAVSAKDMRRLQPFLSVGSRLTVLP